MKLPLSVVTICLAIFFHGCGRPPDADPPVATPAFSANRTSAPLGSPLEVTYRFAVSDDAPAFDQEYRVLVHFLDADEKLMWTDDHDPPIPTTHWRPGQVVEYARTVFIPIYPYIGQAWVQMGLYSPAEQRRLPLAGDNRGQRAYRVAALQLLPQSENIFLIYRDGWHPAEVSPENPTIEWQWTSKQATISFRNPKRDVLLYLHVDARPDLFDEPQQVTVWLGDTELDAFEADSTTPIVHRIPVAEEQLGEGEMVELRLEVDKTFIPARTAAAGAPRDPRELGIRVFNVYVETRPQS